MSELYAEAYKFEQYVNVLLTYTRPPNRVAVSTVERVLRCVVHSMYVEMRKHCYEQYPRGEKLVATFKNMEQVKKRFGEIVIERLSKNVWKP